MWITAATDPFGNRGELISRLYGMVGGTVDGHARLCAAAWLLDESELAVRLLRESLSRLRAPGVRGNCGATVSALQWACIDTGRWDEPLLACREATDLAAAYKMEAVAASASLATATVLAMRGVHDQVRPLVTSVLATIDAAEYRGFAARAWRAAGIAALAEGRYLTGYAQLSQLFGADGAPLHHRVSYLGIADLAAAAVRAERYLERGGWWNARWPGWTPRLARGWISLPPAPGVWSPSPRTPSLTSPRPCPPRLATPGR